MHPSEIHSEIAERTFLVHVLYHGIVIFIIIT